MNKKDKQMFWFFAIIILVFAAFLGVYFYKLSLNKFSYDGLKWQIENSPEPYHAQIITVYNPNLTFNYYARVDPRKNNVTVNPLALSFFKNTTISLSPDAMYCEGANLPIYKLSSFLTLFVGLTTKSGVNDINYSRELKMPYVTCKDAVNQTVVLIEKGNTSQILQEGDCYIVQIGDCSRFIATEEKFTTAIMAEVQKARLAGI